MKDDRAKHKILPPSRFGLIEITRQRVRPQTTIKTQESCPSCNGTGEIEAPIILIDQLKEKLDFLSKDKSIKNLTLVAHPFIIAYLKNGWPSFQMSWSFRNRSVLYLREDNSCALLDYLILDGAGKKISF